MFEFVKPYIPCNKTQEANAICDCVSRGCRTPFRWFRRITGRALVELNWSSQFYCHSAFLSIDQGSRFVTGRKTAILKFLVESPNQLQYFRIISIFCPSSAFRKQTTLKEWRLQKDETRSQNQQSTERKQHPFFSDYSSDQGDSTGPLPFTTTSY